MITVERSAEKIMYDDAVKAFPDECCGFMYGHEDAAGNRMVTQALPINNAAVENRKRRFEIAPKDYMKGERHAVENDLELLGIYHSHPNHPAIPSEHDRVAAQPFFSYYVKNLVYSCSLPYLYLLFWEFDFYHYQLSAIG